MRMTHQSKAKFRRPKIGRVQNEILTALSGGDVLVGFLLSARSSKRMYRIAHERALRRHRDKRAIEHLAALKYLRIEGGRLSITEKGKSVLRSIIGATRRTLQERAWDGKWRIVFFDIPEIYAALRDRVRSILKRAGFVQLQQSIWIFPHDCEELVEFIREESGLSKYVLYGVLERIGDDARLRKLFKLM